MNILEKIKILVLYMIMKNNFKKNKLLKKRKIRKRKRNNKKMKKTKKLHFSKKCMQVLALCLIMPKMQALIHRILKTLKCKITFE